MYRSIHVCLSSIELREGNSQKCLVVGRTLVKNHQRVSSWPDPGKKIKTIISRAKPA